MNAARTIPGRPVRSGTEAADAIVGLVASTLDPSPDLAPEAIRAELAAVIPALAVLATGGHLTDGALLLTAADLRLTINVPVGEAALTATANIVAPRGAATAKDWTLYLPLPESLAALVRSASSTCVHVSTEPPPPEGGASEAKASSSRIDLTRLLDGSNR